MTPSPSSSGAGGAWRVLYKGAGGSRAVASQLLRPVKCRAPPKGRAGCSGDPSTELECGETA
eukprot:3529422-Alexandrium_andersonii.AAC.1